MTPTSVLVGGLFNLDWPSSVVGIDDTGDPMVLPKAA